MQEEKLSKKASEGQVFIRFLRDLASRIGTIPLNEKVTSWAPDSELTTSITII